MSLQAAPDYSDLYDYAGSTHDVDPAILAAMGNVEDTSGDPAAVSPKGATGVMQLMPAAAAEVGVTDRTDPAQSINGGAAYFRKMLDQSGGDVPTAIAKFNAGPNGDLSNPETRAYVAKVIGAYQTAQAKSNIATDATDAPPDPAAPAAATTFDQAAFNKRWGIDTAPAAPAAPAAVDQNAFNQRWGITSTGAALAPATTPTAAPVAAATPGPQDPADLPPPIPGDSGPPSALTLGDRIQDLKSGFKQGFLVKPAELAGRAQAAILSADSPTLAAIDRWSGYTPANVAAGNAALADEDQTYQATAGQTMLGATGNVLGNAAITAPAYMLGGAALGAAARGGATALAGVPVAGRVAATVAPYIAGDGGSTLAGKIAAGSASGAAQGAGAAALTGGNVLVGAASGAAGGGMGGAGGYVASKLTGAAGNALREIQGAAQPDGAVPEVSLGELGPGANGTPGVDAPPPVLPQSSVDKLTATLPPAPVGLQFSKDPVALGSRADDVIAHFNGGRDPVPAPDPANTIPGVNLTAGALTGNAGVASLENTFRQNPLYKEAFRQNDLNNNTGRLNYLNGLTGDPDALDAMIADRKANYLAGTAALTGPDAPPASPVDTQPLLDHIDGVLAGPDGLRDQVSSALGNIRDKLVTGTNPDGTPALLSDPKMLVGLRAAINDQMSKAPTAASATPAALAQLGDARDVLDQHIEEGLPGYSAVRQAYADASRPIDQATYLQNLFAPQLLGGNKPLTTQQLNSALVTIARAQAKPNTATAPVQSVTPDTIQALIRLRNNLQSEGNMATAANGRGSATFGNLATNAIMGHVGGGSNPLSLSNLALTGAAAGGDYLAGLGGPAGVVLGTGISMARHGLASSQAAASAGVEQAIAARMLNPSLLRGAPPLSNPLSTPQASP